MKIVVNGHEITEDAYRREEQQIRTHMRGAPDAQIKETAIRRIVERTLLRQEANRRIGDVSSADVQQALDRLMEQHGGREQFFRRFNLSHKDESNLRGDIRQDIKIDRLLDLIGRDAPAPSDQQVREYYEKNSDDFVAPEQVHAFHIVKQVTPATGSSVLREMVAIRRKLLDGADFAATADECSSCSDEKGDLGLVERGKMVEEFEVVIFSLNEGEISPVFKTPFGYHIATITEKHPRRPLSFEEARDEIRELLHGRARRERVERWLEEARAKAMIEVDENAGEGNA
ncbi:MAG: hypothetical protein GF331_15640 [Chitinivibrionales bacterium]|nr:hypothetical protein [Chitinivibrionales bacterium]